MTLRDPNIGVVLNDRYRIEAVLGRGGFGTVYRGLHLDLERPVAIKILVGTGEDEATHRQRFRQEAQVLDRLRHPSIVRLKDFGEADGLVFMVQEFVDGPTLEAQIHDSGPLSPEAAVTVLADVLDGLAEAHAAGVVHRDVKPANIMMPEPHRGRLLDFGIATVLGQVRKTRTGLLIGTPEYMAPEYIRGGRPEPAGDLYAVGGVLYFALTGQGPLAVEPDASPHAQLLAQIERPTPRLPPDLPPGLQSVLDRALAKAPDARFPDAGAMSHALRSALDGAAVADRVTPTMGSRVIESRPPAVGGQTQVLFSMPPSDGAQVGRALAATTEARCDEAPVGAARACEVVAGEASEGGVEQATARSVIVAPTVLLDGEGPHASGGEGPRGTRVYGEEGASHGPRLAATIMTTDAALPGGEASGEPRGSTARVPAPEPLARVTGRQTPEARPIEETDLALDRLEPPERTLRASKRRGLSAGALALIVSLGAALGILVFAVVPETPPTVHAHTGHIDEADATAIQRPIAPASVDPAAGDRRVAPPSTTPELRRPATVSRPPSPPASLARLAEVGVPPLLARPEQSAAPAPTKARPRRMRRARRQRPEDPWASLDAFFDAVTRKDCAVALRYGRDALRAKQGRPELALLTAPYREACPKAPPLLERR